MAGGDRSILALALVGGELFIGGQFDRCNLTEVSNIARFDPAMNSFSALGSGVNDWVYDFAVDGTDLYVGGSFTQAGGNAVNGVAKFDTTQTGDQAWSALGAGVTFGGSPGTVRALEVVGGGLFAGGFFDEANGSPALNIARFDLAQSAWTAVGSGVNSLGVYAFASSGNALFVGGAFSSAGGKAASRVAKYDVAQSGNTGWSTLGSGVYRTINPVAAIVNALTMIGTDLYVGGTFTEAGNALTVNGLAKFDTGATGNAGWAELDSGLGLDGAKGVASLTAIGTYLYIGGAFDTAGGTPADNIVRFDTTKTDSFIWLEVGLGVDSTVAALAVSGSELYVGGAFSSAGARGMNGVARFDTNQVISDTPNDGWSSLGGGVSSTIWAMTAIGTDIYVGGQFNQVGNISASRIAKFDTTKKGDQGWSALGDGANGTVRALTSVGTDLYVGGSFTEVGNGLSANRIAKFDTT
ncbi:MAG: hypothetical protein V2J20_03175, partial [Wenzhouxiangella sp.]|nr:hypothetical protein [Wenzhouxiangella sp.]